MGLVGKLKNWINLWLGQFSIKNIENRRCSDNDSILIIKLDAIGDFIIWLDSAKEYKRLFPGKRCVLMCNKSCKELAEVTDYFDEVITLDIKKFEQDKRYREEEIKKNKSQEYGILIQTEFSRTQHMDIIAASIPAKTKIGFVAEEGRLNISRRVLLRRNKKVLDGIYDKLIPSSKMNLMEIQRNKEFIIGLGNKDFKSSMPILPAIANVQISNEKYFIVFPGASTKIKTWRPEHFADVINYLIEHTGWICCVCGGSDDRYLFEKIRRKTNNVEKLKNYCGKTNLVELIEIVRNAEIVISNDTSGIHFANAVGTKGVCPFGEYNYGRFLPYVSDKKESTIKTCSMNVKCRGCSNAHLSFNCILNILINGRYLCLDKVPVDYVIKTINECLRGDTV